MAWWYGAGPRVPPCHHATPLAFCKRACARAQHTRLCAMHTPLQRLYSATGARREGEVIRSEHAFGSKLNRIECVISRDLKRWSGAFFLYMRYAERRLSERGVACAHTFVRARSHDGRATGAPRERGGDRPR